MDLGDVKNYIDNKRKEQGMMAKDIAKHLEISVRQYNRLVRGEQNISKYIYRLAKLFNVSTDEFFFRLDRPKCSKNNEEE